MKVFVLGGTGTIGTALVAALCARSHEVTALSRSVVSDRMLIKWGATPMRGDLREPDMWVQAAVAHDAIIHVAATFTDDMGDVDERVVSAIIQASVNAKGRLRLLYTGGCWLYGETGDEVATEERPFDPLAAFGWMVDHGEMLLDTPHLSTAIIHPAMVYHAMGGVFHRFHAAGLAGKPLEIWGGPDTRWPLIERSDLARAYCDLLTRPDLTGHFNAVAETGVFVGDIAGTFAARYGLPAAVSILDVDHLVAQHGGWARGPVLDQQMSAQKLMTATGWQPQFTDYRSSTIFTA